MSVWRHVRATAAEANADESGQVTFLFVFASVALVVLLAFVVNTVRQTSRKIEMQGAADAGALASGVWMARGMNLMVLNNKGMGDLLAVMIDVHAVYQTAQTMVQKLPAIVAGLEASAASLAVVAPEVSAFLAGLADDLTEEEAWWVSLASSVGQIDQELSNPSTGLGWSLMEDLDKLNQYIKVSLPPGAEYEAREFAQKNGANAPQTPLPGPAWFVSGQPGLVPVFPVGRGGHVYLVSEAKTCTLDDAHLEDDTRATLTSVCFITNTPCLSGIYAWPIFGTAIDSNVSALNGGKPTGGSITPDDLRNLHDASGQSIGDVLSQYNQAHAGDSNYVPVNVNLNNIAFSGGSPLSWPSTPPEPMILTDHPQVAGDATVDPNAPIELAQVQKLLQFLTVAFGQMEPHGLMGGDTFNNYAALNRWMTYGQADVYNPVDWSMFSQEWRARLARATLLQSKSGELMQTVGFSKSSIDFAFVNTH